LSPLTCPECDGSMQEIRENGVVRYRCHTGHAFTLENLRVAAGEAWERTLYGGLRAQQQQAMVCRRLAEDARGRGEDRVAVRYEQRAGDYEEGAVIIRRLLAAGGEADAGS
jgi:two-component system, chemotaxis family, protein-glutamate methylesterase/glutaminase